MAPSPGQASAPARHTDLSEPPRTEAATRPHRGPLSGPTLEMDLRQDWWPRTSRVWVRTLHFSVFVLSFLPRLLASRLFYRLNRGGREGGGDWFSPFRRLGHHLGRHGWGQGCQEAMGGFRGRAPHSLHLLGSESGRAAWRRRTSLERGRLPLPGSSLFQPPPGPAEALPPRAGEDSGTSRETLGLDLLCTWGAGRCRTRERGRRLRWVRGPSGHPHHPVLPRKAWEGPSAGRRSSVL